MKTAIYIEDGVTQFVLTPETEIDRKVVDELEKSKELKTYRGAFYNCQGGWTRWSYQLPSVQIDGDDYSLIFRIEKK